MLEQTITDMSMAEASDWRPRVLFIAGSEAGEADWISGVYKSYLQAAGVVVDELRPSMLDGDTWMVWKWCLDNAYRVVVSDLREYPASWQNEVIRGLPRVIWVYAGTEWPLGGTGWREASLANAALACVFPSRLALEKATARAGRAFRKAEVVYPMPDVDWGLIRRERSNADDVERALWRGGVGVWIGSDFDGSEALALRRGGASGKVVLYVVDGAGRFEVENFSSDVEVVLDGGILRSVLALARVIEGNTLYQGVPSGSGWLPFGMAAAIARRIGAKVETDGELGVNELDKRQVRKAAEESAAAFVSIVLG